MSPIAQRFRSFLGNQNVLAFLQVIRKGEGTVGPEGYRTLYGGELFDSYDDHPRRLIAKASGYKKIVSSAAGAYQILERTWDSLKSLELPDFSPDSQDIAAVALINRRDALADVVAGRFEAAVRKCNREWASLPGSPYGQPTLTMDKAKAVYRSCGGLFEYAGQDAGGPASATAAAGAAEPAAPPAPVEDRPLPPYRPESQPQEIKPMAPALAFALNAVKLITPYVPDLIRKFGTDGSKITERNAKAAEVVAQIAVEATGAKNAQEAAELVVSDMDARNAVVEQIRSRWFEIAEAGGGGISGAREFAERNAGNRYGRVIEVISYGALGFLLLANLGVGLATIIAAWRDSSQLAALMNLGGMVVQADIGAAMTAFGFWLGAAWKQGVDDPAD